MTPYGLPGSIGPSPIGDLRMRWEGIWAVSTHILDWEYTRNVTTLRELTWPLATVRHKPPLTDLPGTILVGLPSSHLRCCVCWRQGVAKMWRCWLVHTESPGAPDGYLLVDRSEQLDSPGRFSEI